MVEVVFDAEGRGTEGPLRLEFDSWDHRLVRVEVPTLPRSGARPAEQGAPLPGLTYDAFSRALLGVRENVHG